MTVFKIVFTRDSNHAAVEIKTRWLFNFGWENQGEVALKKYSFILYVAGNLPNSVQAICNLKALCSEYFSENHHLEIVDVFSDPERGLSDGVVAIPTLVKLVPAPKQTIIGSLTDIPLVLRSLGWAGPLSAHKEDPIQ